MACQDMVQERLGLGSLAVLSSKIWRSTLHLHVKEIVRVRNEVANCVVRTLAQPYRPSSGAL